MITAMPHTTQTDEQAGAQTDAIIQSILDLEKRLASLRTLVNPDTTEKPVKPRAENAWVIFTARVDALMKKNKTTFLTLGESKKFCSLLKKKRGYECTDEEIIREQVEWDKTYPPCCIECNEPPTGRIEEHRQCIVEYCRALLEHGKRIPNPVESWMRASRIKFIKAEKEMQDEINRQTNKSERKKVSMAKKAAELAKPLFDINPSVLLEDLESVISQ